jgi:hypothetical protein
MTAILTPSIVNRIAVMNALKKADPHAELIVRLLKIKPEQAQERSLIARLDIASKLAIALRVERTRGKSGHYLYDVNRHINLIQALRVELKGLDAAATFEKESLIAEAKQACSSSPSRSPR